MTEETLTRELNAALPDGLRGVVELDATLDCDYVIACEEATVRLSASRPRNARCGMGDIEDTLRSGRRLTDKRVRSPLARRMVEAWAPMHSHMYLPLPEYHEHSWHVRMRSRFTLDVVESEMEMAITRFEAYARLLARQGFTHIVLDDQDTLVLFPRHPEIYPEGEGYHRRHVAYRRMFKRLLDITAAQDMSFVLYCQEIGFTPPSNRFFGPVCPANERMWTHLDEKYDELVETFPEIEGYMFKVSDSFPPIDHLYYHTDLFRHACDACRDLTDVEKLRMFVRRLSERVAARHGKDFYYRTWDVSHGIHVDIEKHRALFAGVTGENIFPLLKYTKGDFQLSNPPHPGIGGMPNQVVEYQFKLEHDGHGSLPLYIGAVHEASLRENVDKGIAGIWGWPVGGGSASINNIAYFKGFTRFVEMNQYVFSRKMMELDIPHTEFLAQWGDLVLGAGNGPALASLLCDLTEGFRLIANFGDLWTGPRAYSVSKFHHGWFFDWQHFRHGQREPEGGGDTIREQVLPHIKDIDAACARMHESAARFKAARVRFEGEIRRIAGYDHEYATFWTQFLAAEAFARLCALWVEVLLRFYSGNTDPDRLRTLLDRLEEAKHAYDRNHGLFVTQCMDYFIPRARARLGQD